MATYKIVVNGQAREVEATPDIPLLYVLRNQLHLQGPLFGCGLAQCGACAVLVGDQEVRSCVTRMPAAAGKTITTLEGLAALWARQRGLDLNERTLHPLQQAWIDERVPQCGYCQGGMILQAVALLSRNARPTDTQIRSGMNGHLCRCGTHLRILRAIKRAAAQMV